MPELDVHRLADDIRTWAAELGFQQTGITDTGLAPAGERLEQWLAHGYQGDMQYMARHRALRKSPAALLPGCRRIISVRMDYLPASGADPLRVLDDPRLGYVSRYALGRDYHKLIRRRLQRLADRIVECAGPFGYRAFTDSAPVLEKPLAVKAGLGWQGKHTNLINRHAGSWFFLGELFTDLPLPVDRPASDHCGQCHACIDVCPTRAIVAPYVLDARLCISYLTIEHQGPIPEPLRPLLGNRIYGCDDCQLVCPWNRFARSSPETDYLPRHGLDQPRLRELLAWNETTFLDRTEGSPIRRLGHMRWQRNIAVALGNGPADTDTLGLLERLLSGSPDLVAEHLRWSIARLRARLAAAQPGS